MPPSSRSRENRIKPTSPWIREELPFGSRTQRASMRLLWSGTALDRLRLWSGLVLFVFAATHFLIHALGLWSLAAVASVQHWRIAVTHSRLGSALLAASFLTHASLALWKLARMRTLRLRRAEI